MLVAVEPQAPPAVSLEPTSAPTAALPQTPRAAWQPIVRRDDDRPAFPEAPLDWKSPSEDLPRGRLEKIAYDSRVVGTRRWMQVYTPPGYATGTSAHPVLYLLHGIGGDENEWVGFAQPHLLLDRLIAVGKAVPMIVVMPNGRAQKDDRPAGTLFQHAPAFAAFERDLLEEVVPTIEARFRTRPGREHRAIAGLSMGGGQALNFGFAHADRFSWIGAFSPAPNTRTSADLFTAFDRTRTPLKLLWLSCGDQDGLLHIGQDLHASLKALELPHVWHVSRHGHNAAEWRQALFWFLQQLRFDG